VLDLRELQMARHIKAAFVTMMGIVLLGGPLLAYSGLYSVAAVEPHWAVTHWVLDIVRLRSIRVHADGITVPPGLTDDSMVVKGAGHFAAHCSLCHGAPGVSRDDFAQSLYPSPPDLAGVVNTYGPGELFWILRNGIRATGMPAWHDHGDDELWTIVAFLQRLVVMSPQDYSRLLIASGRGSNKHRHGDADGPHAIISSTVCAPDLPLRHE
jgi:mono/diheme cytochrome c family protein